MHVVPSTKDIPSSPSPIKALEHGQSRETTNLNLFNYPLPSHFSIKDEAIPNLMFDLRDMPLFMIENFIVTFDPNGPHSNPPEEMRVFFCFSIYLALAFGLLSQNKNKK
jgi:hypothetical protein